MSWQRWEGLVLVEQEDFSVDEEGFSISLSCHGHALTSPSPAPISLWRLHALDRCSRSRVGHGGIGSQWLRRSFVWSTVNEVTEPVCNQNPNRHRDWQLQDEIIMAGI